jgi:hypothetical protein
VASLRFHHRLPSVAPTGAFARKTPKLYRRVRA